jgi:hypothetical protein
MARTLLAAALVGALLSGCATYIPPGPKADLQALAAPDIEAGFAAKPSRPFPASIAVVRIQGGTYSNHYLRRHGGMHGSGRYTVIMVKELDEQKQLERVHSLPQVAGLVTLNRLLLPERLESDREIRAAAARLQADLVLLYTMDTAFFDTNLATPLSVITLGLSPTRQISAVSTASALLLDTRTGFIYSAYEATEKTRTLSTSWGSSDSADEARQKAERDAFRKLVDDLISTWPRVLERYGKK